MTTWCFSDNEEVFHNTHEAETREQAVEHAFAVLDLDVGDSVFVGIKEDVNPENFLCAEHFLEDITERICDDVGEVADGWPSASKADVELLDEMLRNTFTKWIVLTRNQPTFYRVSDVTEHRRVK